MRDGLPLVRLRHQVVLSVRPLLPRRDDYSGPRGFWMRDLAAGVTVGIVARFAQHHTGRFSGCSRSPSR